MDAKTLRLERRTAARVCLVNSFHFNVDKKEHMDSPLEIHHDSLRITHIILFARIWNVYILELTSFNANAYGTIFNTF